jgi:feS assembly protein iscX
LHETYIKKGFFMKLNWHDSLDIAIALAEKHPDVDVQYIRFTDLHRYVCELDDFVGEPDKSSEAILEAIQMAWLDELD